MIETVGRPAGDVLSRIVRLRFGGREFVLPVLPIAGNRRWKETLDHELGTILAELRKAGTKGPGLVDVLSGQVDKMLALIRSYDATGVLPADLEEFAYEEELVVAVQEVWLAANPLVDTVLQRLKRETAAMIGSSGPTSSPPRNTAGRPRRSKTN